MFTRCVVPLTVLLCSATALAHPDVDAAANAYDQGELYAALVHLDRAQQDPALTEDELVQALWLRASCQLALKAQGDAERAFDEILVVKPLYEPSHLEASPMMQEAFSRRARAWHAEHGVEIGDPIVEGRRVRVPLKSAYGGTVSTVLYLRVPDEPTYRAIPLATQGDTALGQISDDTLMRGTLDAVVEVRNARGVPLSRRGTREHPITLQVQPVTSSGAHLASLPVVLGGVWLGVGLPVAVLLTTGAIASVGIAGGALAVAWLHPRYPGAEVSPTYRLAVASHVAAVTLALALGLVGGVVGVGTLVGGAALITVGQARE